MDLVDEEERPLPHLTAAARRVEDLLQLRDAGMDGGDLLEMQVRLFREKPCDRRFARPRRPPENQEPTLRVFSMRVSVPWGRGDALPGDFASRRGRSRRRAGAAPPGQAGASKRALIRG